MAQGPWPTLYNLLYACIPHSTLTHRVRQLQRLAEGRQGRGLPQGSARHEHRTRPNIDNHVTHYHMLECTPVLGYAPLPG